MVKLIHLSSCATWLLKAMFHLYSGWQKKGKNDSVAICFSLHLHRLFRFDSFSPFPYYSLFCFEFFLCPSKISSSVCGFRHFCGKDNVIVMLLLLAIFTPAFLFLNCQSIQNLFDNTPASLLIMCQMSLV